MSVFTRVVLFTDTDGRARFREEPVPLDEVGLANLAMRRADLDFVGDPSLRCGHSLADHCGRIVLGCCGGHDVTPGMPIRK